MNILCKIVLFGLIINSGSIEAGRTRNRQGQPRRKVILVEEEKPAAHANLSPQNEPQNNADFKTSCTEPCAEKETADESIMLKPMDIVANVKEMADVLKSRIKKLVKDKVDGEEIYALKEKIVEIISSMSHVMTEHKDILKEEAHRKIVKITMNKIDNTYLEWAEAIGHGKALSEEVFPEFCAIDQAYQKLQKLVKH